MAINTLRYAKRLQEAGFPREQAEAQAEALDAEITPQLATTADLSRVEQSLKADIDGLEQRLKADIGGLEQRLKAEIATAVARLEVTMWKHTATTLGGLIATAIAIVGLLARLR
jgi:hypothetical protein